MTEPDRLIHGTHFSEMRPPAPEFEELAARYQQLEQDWENAPDRDARRRVLDRWEQLRRGFATWYELAQVRFTQATGAADARAERERADELEPRVTSLEVGFLDRLLGGPHRAELEALGGQATALWELSGLPRARTQELPGVRVAHGLLRQQLLDQGLEVGTQGAVLRARGGAGEA